MYPRIEDAGHYSPFHTIPFSVEAWIGLYSWS